MQNKQRHGCLTAWLIYLIIAYSLNAYLNFLKPDDISKITPFKTSENMNLIYGSLAIFGIAFSIMLLKWLKLGFWGILTISIILIVTRIINENQISTSSFYILLCLMILCGLLQLKKANISGWKNLD